MRLKVNSQFTKLSASSGTIQNTGSQYGIEVSDSPSAEGIVLYPRQKFSFSNTTLYVRCLGGGAECRFVPFADSSSSGSGGGSSSGQTVPEDQVATDEDIQSLIDDIFG